MQIDAILQFLKFCRHIETCFDFLRFDWVSYSVQNRNILGIVTVSMFAVLNNFLKSIYIKSCHATWDLFRPISATSRTIILYNHFILHWA